MILLSTHAGAPNLSGSTRDEEPLVNAWVDWCSWKCLVGRDRWELLRSNVACRSLDSEVGAGTS